jgi:hypothetical protein
MTRALNLPTDAWPEISKRDMCFLLHYCLKLAVRGPLSDLHDFGRIKFNFSNQKFDRLT